MGARRGLLAFCEFAVITSCAPPPHPTVAQIQAPALKAPSAEESREFHRRSDLLLAKWNSCEVDAAKRLARTQMTAPEAVSQAIASCNTSRNEWIQAQVDYGIRRYDAETV